MLGIHHCSGKIDYEIQGKDPEGENEDFQMMDAFEPSNVESVLGLKRSTTMQNGSLNDRESGGGFFGRRNSNKMMSGLRSALKMRVSSKLGLMKQSSTSALPKIASTPKNKSEIDKILSDSLKRSFSSAGLDKGKKKLGTASKI